MSVDFRSFLTELCQELPGVALATIMGADGIPVDSVDGVGAAGSDPAALLVEYSALLVQAGQSAQMLGAGALQEVVVRSERLSCVLRVLNSDFFLALVLTSGASLGKSRFALRVASPHLAEALA